MYIAPEQYHDSMFDIFLTKKAKGYLHVIQPLPPRTILKIYFF